MNKKFILTNDPDHGNLPRLKNVFNALNYYDIPITTAVFCTMEKDDSGLSRHCYRGETGALDEPEYRDFMLEQKERGHEIAFHGYSQISNRREKFIEGLEIYKEVFGEYPFTYMEHGGLPGHHPDTDCKKERIDWLGSEKDSIFYVKDVIKEKIKCVWARFDLLDGPELWTKNPNPRGREQNLIPKQDSDLFYTEDNILFFKRWRTHYLNKMYHDLRNAKMCTFIAYTHFGYDAYAEKGFIHDDWRTERSCMRSAKKIREIVDNCDMKILTVKDNIMEMKNGCIIS